ncbi:MAG TPA: hypothetical protein VFJ29_03055 [Candidatus Kapabacteria bacterium]|nr:hypothetical protein [Candidatus Kapabacteria bacterium]
MIKRLFIVILSVAAAQSFAQIRTGTGAPQTQVGGVDTNMVFKSPRPLIESASAQQIRNAWGLDILFSNNGFGLGVFYRHSYSRDITGFGDVEFSGVKNTDEFNTYDPYTGYVLGPAGKLNDVYMATMAFGVQYRLFADEISDAFRPYINAGVGPTVVMAAPDSLQFFSSIGHARFLVLPGGYVGIGANIGNPHSISGVNFRYYYIRSNADVESIQGHPITDYGGFFITLNWGIAF